MAIWLRGEEETVGNTCTDIAVIAAGTGGKMMVDGLSQIKGIYPSLFTIITDSGGSTAAWREGGAPGDMRKQISMLIPEGEGGHLLRDQRVKLSRAFEHRYEAGPFPKHPMGNQFIYALAKECDDLDEALQIMNALFGLPIPVYPISDSVDPEVGAYPTLQGRWANGNIFTEEATIDKPGEENKPFPIVEAWLSSPVKVNPRLQTGLLTGKIRTLTIGPGSLYGSTVAALLTGGLKEAIDNAPDLTIVYICNMATRPGETIGLSVTDHINVVNRYLGCHKIDIALISRYEPTPEMVDQYRSKHQELLIPSQEEIASLPCETVVTNFMEPGKEGQAYHDPLRTAIEVVRIGKRQSS
jgi:uncharacterized cofD-like protein